MGERAVVSDTANSSGDYLPPRPWSLAPLQGKFYGTKVLDARGRTVCEMWLCAGPPSPREDIDWEDVSDSHYESMADYQTALLICEAANAEHFGREGQVS